MSESIEVEVSIGELLDKISILEIKMERIRQEEKLFNIRKELNHLRQVCEERVPSNEIVEDLFLKLKETNEVLWDIEDEIRECEREKDFGAKFISLARSVYKQNDLRCHLKRELNDKLGSGLKEEKSYAEYSFNA
jgi:hypothetical protein